MIPEVGNFALVLALCVSVVQGVVPLLGAHKNYAPWVALARPSAALAALFSTLAFTCLAYAALDNDFSVRYVATHSNTLLPTVYRLAAVWGGHEGSLLLWVLMLTCWGLAVAIFSRGLEDTLRARVLAVLGLIATGFFLFMLLTSNPFERLVHPPVEGRDLNPLLQDPGLVIHPPLLYMGYVGFSVAYAFAMAALIAGRLDSVWVRWSRPWTLAAWSFLTMGIGLGSWWAYYELGWGGWWFWDPVENASFMPWLVGVALLHSLAVSEKRGCFKNWTVLLALGAFSLSLLGTFLVRSGVLTSVHAFATDPQRGVFILIFLVIVVGVSLLLYAWRAPSVGLGGRFGYFSRESLLLGNNLLLITAAGSVLLGTIYPLMIDALGLGKISVGPPYFNTVFIPVMLPLGVLIAVGVNTRWREDKPGRVARRLLMPMLFAVPAGLLLPLYFERWSPLVALALIVAFWILASGKLDYWRRAAATQSNSGALGWSMSCLRQPLGFLGMHIAHGGVAVFMIGATLVSAYEVEKDVRMAVGGQVAVGGYNLRFDGVRKVVGPNYRALQGEVVLFDDEGQVEKILHPEKRHYFSSPMPMTEAAIDVGIFRDIYISLGEPIDKHNPEGEWAVRVYYKPFVDWLWAGSFFMALGALLALFDRRYRLSASKETVEKEVWKQ